MAVPECAGPEFQLIDEDARNCAAPYCLENARYWVIWKRTMSITRSILSIRRAVCRTHRESIEGKTWNEVSESFRPNFTKDA